MNSEAHQRDRAARAAPKATAQIAKGPLFALVLLFTIAGCGQKRPAPLQALFDNAKASFRTEHYQAALSQTAEALKATDASSEVYWKLRLLKAEILLGKRDAAGALEALKFEFPSRFHTPRNNAEYLYCRGFATSMMGDFNGAWPLLDQASALARDSGNNELLAEIQNRQGIVAIRQGKYPEGEELIRHALQYAQAHSLKWLEISATGSLGTLFLRQNRYEDAIPYLEKAEAEARAVGSVETEARNKGNRGFCYYKIGDLDRAIGALQPALSLFEKTGNLAEQENWLGIIGNIHLARNEYPEAATYYKRALDIARVLGDQGTENAAFWLSNLARVLIEIGDFDAAEIYNNEGMALKRRLKDDKTAEMYSELNAAKIATARHKYPEAEKLVREILRKTDDDPTLSLRAHEQLAIILDATHRDAAAEAEYRATLRKLESGRNQLQKPDSRLAYLSTLIGFYQDFVLFLMERGKTNEALAVADSSHGRTMMERLNLAHSGARRTDFQKLAAASHSTLLVYSLGGIKSYLWIVTPDAIKAVELPADTELRPLIEAYDKSIQDLRDPLSEPNSAAQKLYQILVAPAAESVARTGEVIIVPDGLLYSLNFETLPVPGEKPHYWIDDATISIAPSLSLLNVSARHEGAPGSLLLIGNPVSPDPAFPDLKFAAQEMSSIERSLPSARQVMLARADARPGMWTQVKPGQFDLIHFTAHATASREEPLSSAVILSRDEGGNYRLHAQEVMQTPIQARLVTISACRGAGTRIYSGEGLVGLAWAFLESGARNVIAGLWDVNDESGAKVMSRLYQDLALGKIPSASLRDAKRELIHSGGVYRKPWYWGPFQLFTTQVAQ